MNKIKKFASIATAVLMTACMTAPMMSSFAANQLLITVNVTDQTVEHHYQAYQIFAGLYDTDSGIFTDIKWGDNIQLTRPGISEGATISLYDELAKINTGTDTNPVYPFTNAGDGNTRVPMTDPREVADVLDAAAKAVTSGASTKDMEITKQFADVVSKFAYVPPEFASSCTFKSKTNREGDKITGYTIDVSKKGAGYYLVQDQDDSLGSGDQLIDDVYTRYILTVVGNSEITINPKSTKPSVEKKVYEESLANETGNIYGAGYNDVADYDIGDMVPFKLYGSLPSDAKEYDEYDAYFYQFVDKLGEEFTFEEHNNVNSLVHVYYEDTKNGTKKEIVNSYPQDVDMDIYNKDHIVLTGSDIVKQWSDSTNTLTVTIENIKEFAVPGEGRITVEYEARLNNQANVGYDGQVNGVYLNYSNDVNEHWKPKKNYTTDIYDEPETKGQTPEDGVIVFTYGIGINKVIQDTSERLAGAKFAVYCDAYETETITVTEEIVPDSSKPDEKIKVTSEKTKEYEVYTYESASGTIDYYKNGSDWYTQEKDATTGAKSYKQVNTEIASTLNAEYTNINKEDAKLKRKKAYIKTKDSYPNQYDGFLDGTPNIDTAGGDGTNGVWESDGYNNIVIKGLDKDRVYYIEELKAPEKYNKLDNPVKFKIVSKFNNESNKNEGKEIYPNHKWTYSETGNYQNGFTALDDIHLIVNDDNEKPVNVTYNPGAGGSTSTSGSGSGSSTSGGGGNPDDNNLGIITIENSEGVELPGTGGIGTTFLYAGGSLMVAVAGIFLITQKRMGRKED